MRNYRALSLEGIARAQFKTSKRTVDFSSEIGYSIRQKLRGQAAYVQKIAGRFF